MKLALHFSFNPNPTQKSDKYLNIYYIFDTQHSTQGFLLEKMNHPQISHNVQDKINVKNLASYQKKVTRS